MSIDLSGFDELNNQLEELNKRAESLEGTHSVSFTKLFTESFMKKHTHVSSFDEFLQAGNFVVNSQKDFEVIPDDVFDQYVSKATDFCSWEGMCGTATEEYAAAELGF